MSTHGGPGRVADERNPRDPDHGRKLGDVGFQDYARMLGEDATSTGRAGRKWVRRSLAIGAAAVVVLAFAASKLGPWNGRNAAELTFEQVLELLENPAETNHHHEIAVTRAMEFMLRGIERLRDVAEGPTLGKADVYAMVALRTLGAKAITSVVAFDKQGKHRKYVELCLEAWHAALEGR